MRSGTRSELEEDLQKLQQAYAVVFDENNPFAQLVLADLSRFCRAEETTFHPDARIHAVAEGRRETWLRIREFSKLSFDELCNRLILRQKKLNNESSRSAK